MAEPPAQSNRPARGRTELRAVSGFGGRSNSRRTNKNVTPGSSHGFDTVRYRFRGADPDAFGRFLERRPAVQSGGERRLTEDGVTVGWWDDGRAYVEGRLAAILNGKDDHALYGPGELVEGAAVAQELAGAQSAELVKLGRADMTAELVFQRPDEGRRFLAAVAAVDVPWLKTGTEGGKRSGLETVYWRTMRGRSVVLRLYDKGRETDTQEAGVWLRLERQRRWRKERELDVDAVAESDLEQAFVGRELRYLVDEAPRVHVVGGVGHAVAELRRRAAAGQLSGSRAGRLLGYLTLGSSMYPAHTARRNEAELRELGIGVRYEHTHDEIEVAPRLRELAERWAA